MIEHERRRRVVGETVGDFRRAGVVVGVTETVLPDDLQATPNPMPPPCDTRVNVVHFLGHAIFGDVEVGRRQIRDGMSPPVAHDDVHEDRRGRGREGLAVGLLGGGLGSRLRAGEDGRQEDRSDSRGSPHSTIRSIVERNTCSVPCFTTARRSYVPTGS